jgi:hypothetical protein
VVASVICSTCGPPCKQLLIAAGTGAGLSIIGGGGLVSSCPCSVFVLLLHLIICHCYHCHSPPCCCPPPCCSPPPCCCLLCHPPPHHCHCLCHPPPCCLSSPVAILLPVIPIPIAPCSHPASSCSQRRLGVMWWWLSSWCHVTAPASGKTCNCELL